MHTYIYIHTSLHKYKHSYIYASIHTWVYRCGYMNV